MPTNISLSVLPSIFGNSHSVDAPIDFRSLPQFDVPDHYEGSVDDGSVFAVVTQGYGDSSGSHNDDGGLDLFYSLDFVVPGYSGNSRSERFQAIFGFDANLVASFEGTPDGDNQLVLTGPSTYPNGVGNYLTVGNGDIFASLFHLEHDGVNETELTGIVGLTGARDGYHLHISYGTSVVSGLTIRSNPTGEGDHAATIVDAGAGEYSPVRFQETALGTLLEGIVTEDSFDGSSVRNFLTPANNLLDDNVFLVGSNAANISGNDNENILSGNGENNRIEGHGGRDAIWAGEGNDTVFGEGGADTDDADNDGSTSEGLPGFVGEADVIYAGLGNDFAYGGGGDDWIFGDSGESFASDNFHIDSLPEDLVLNFSINPLNDGERIDYRYGDTGIDGADDLRGDAGDDVIFGGAGNDTIYGGGVDSNPEGAFSDDDVIFGGLGDDHLFGELGHDTIFGGSGDEVNGDTAYYEPVTNPGDEFIIEFLSDGGVKIEQVSTSDFAGVLVNGTDILYDVENISFGGIGQSLRVSDFSSGDKIKVVPNTSVNPLLTDLAPGSSLWLISQSNGPLFLDLSGSSSDYQLSEANGGSGSQYTIRNAAGQTYELLSSTVLVSIDGENYQDIVTALTPNPASEDDHGDTRATATLVTNLDGTVVRGEIEVSGDEDYFLFNTQAGRTYGVVATPYNSGIDPQIRIYNSSGQLVASNADLGNGPSAGLSFTSSGGTYYVEISGEGGSTGDYGIGVSDITSDDGGTPPPGGTGEPDEPDVPSVNDFDFIGTDANESRLYSSRFSEDLLIAMQGGDDIVRSGRGDDIILGGDGEDEIEGRDGNDTLAGNDGDDTLEGGDGNDGILGGRGDDRIEGDDGDDLIAGERGDDTIGGGDGDDEIQGNDGEDRIDGDAGDDEISGGDDDDRLDGGSGDDTIYGGDDEDRIDGESGRDALYGDNGDDFIRGGSGADLIEGGDGEDELLGEEGNDSISGGSDGDIIRPGSGNDTVDGDGGSDTLSYESMNGGAVINMITEQAYGADIGFDLFDSIDHIIGTNGNDVIIGDGDDNQLSGDSGQDTITGGAGNDEIDGGSSTDTAVFSGNRADYTITTSANPEFDLQIVDNRAGSPDGTDLLDSIAFLQFADVRIRDDDALSSGPTANNDEFEFSNQGPVILDVLANDTDPDGNALSISAVVSQPASGQAYIVDNRIIFDPNGEAFTNVTLSYRITDGTGFADTATVSVNFSLDEPEMPDRTYDTDGHSDNGNGLGDSRAPVQRPSRIDLNDQNAEDTWVTSVYYGGGLDDGDIRLGGWGDRYEGLFAFDTSLLTDEVVGATLYVYAYKPDSKQFTGFDVYTANGSWDETTKWATRPGQGDLVTTVSAPQMDGWIGIDLSEYLSQVDEGFVLTPHSTSNRFTYLTSTEGVEEFRPYLQLTYADEFVL